MWSWGALFGLIALSARLTGAVAAWWTVPYVTIVAFVMSYAVLPLVGLKPVPESSGWGPFVAMHTAYGIGLGFVFGLGARRAIAVEAERQRRTA